MIFALEISCLFFILAARALLFCLQLFGGGVLRAWRVLRKRAA